MTTKRPNFKNGLFWTIAILTTLANLLFSLASVFELYQISFTHLEKEYHWGADPFPWYYATKNTYLTYIGTWTVLLLTILFFQIYYIIKDNKVKELYAGLLFVLGFVAMLITNWSY